MIRFFRFVPILLALCALFLPAACGDDDDSSDDDAPDDDVNDDTASPADDDTSDDDANDDADDDAFEGVVPTTLDLTLVPAQGTDGWRLEPGAGEAHIERNDLQAFATRDPLSDPLSMGYFLILADQHQADEESPARLDFYGSWEVLFAMFESFHRPQQDLTPQILNAMARTANRLQKDYERDFDMALILGDGSDNSQFNEMKVLIDILDGGGLTSLHKGWVRPDSGDLDIDPDTGLNKGERNFGSQDYDVQGNPNMLYFRAGYPNSNADFPASGLLKSDGSKLPWYYSIGNHDVLGAGGFNPDGGVTCFSKADFVGDVARYGFIPGLASTVAWMKANGNEPLYIANGFFGWNTNWQNLYLLMVLGDWQSEINPQFDLPTLINDTPGDPSDDGIYVTADIKRAFLGAEGLIPLMHGQGHGFYDHNEDGQVNIADGGWYRIDWPNALMPLRILMLDSMDLPAVSEGGMSPAQLSWLKNELDHAVEDKVLVIVGSHHPELEVIAGGVRFQQMLHDCPNVIAHLVGHRHQNQVTPLPDVTGDPLRSHWEIQTPSTVEYPQQGRIIEIVDNRDGTGTIYNTVFDHWPIKGDDSDDLAGLGRDLAFGEHARLRYDDARKFGSTGGVTDRNVALKFQIPDAVADKLADIPSNGLVTSTDVLGHRYESDGE